MCYPVMKKKVCQMLLCAPAEATTGNGTIAGAKNIGGLWRVHPKQKQFRRELLLEGMVHTGMCVTLIIIIIIYPLTVNPDVIL